MTTIIVCHKNETPLGIVSAYALWDGPRQKVTDPAYCTFFLLKTIIWYSL